ncbi:hypothetical protein ACP6C7_30495, partial [Mycolicibacterium septicum]
SQTKDTNNLASKKQPPIMIGRRGVPQNEWQKNNKQKPPNTLLSSQTTDIFCFVTLFWGNPTSLIGILPASQVASFWLISSGLRQPRQLSTFSAGLSSRSGPGCFTRSVATSKD